MAVKDRPSVTPRKPPFDPMVHAKKMKLRGGAGFVDYLPAGAKVRFLNYRFPNATIDVEPVLVNDQQASVKCTVTLPNGARASALGSVFKSSFADYVEKADTRAIARCCTRLGLDINGIYDELAEGYVPVGDEEDYIPEDAEVVEQPEETPAPSSLADLKLTEKDIHEGISGIVKPAIEENDTEKYLGKWNDFIPKSFDYLKDNEKAEDADVELLREEMHASGYSSQAFLRHLFFLEEDAYKAKKIKGKPKARKNLSDIPNSLLEEVMEWLVDKEG